MLFAIHRVVCQNNEAHAYCLTAQHSNSEIGLSSWPASLVESRVELQNPPILHQLALFHVVMTAIALPNFVLRTIAILKKDATSL